jgi:hypothetical protein
MICAKSSYNKIRPVVLEKKSKNIKINRQMEGQTTGDQNNLHHLSALVS